MRTLFILFLFLSGASYAQSVYKIYMKIERIGTNHTEPPTRSERTILIVIEDKFFSIYTGYDTLILYRVKPSERYDVYIDKLHHDQLYYMIRKKTDEGFGIFISPMPPYRRKLWGISLMSI